MKARALIFVAPCRVAIQDVEVPDPGEGQVLVAAEWSGISAGTELLAYRGEVDPEMPLDETLPALGGTFRFPFRYGYSVAGRVERGALPAGTRVFAFHPHQDRFVADASQVAPLGDLDARRATLYPLVETALQVALDAAPRSGDVAVVTGLGAVGVLIAALLQRSGARAVGSEPLASRRRAADAIGVEAVAPDDLPPIVDEATGGRGADLVVEASGRPEVLAGSLGLLRHEGSVWVCSWYGTKPVPLPLGGAFHRRRLSIRSTQVSSIPGAQGARGGRRRRSETAWRLMSELPLDVLATHDFPFDRAEEAFAALDRGEDAIIHAALRYGEGA